MSQQKDHSRFHIINNNNLTQIHYHHVSQDQVHCSLTGDHQHFNQCTTIPRNKLGYSTPTSPDDPNSFESLILNQDKFLMDLANFIAKMNVTAKRRLWDHRVVFKQTDGSKTIQTEISQQPKQMVYFLIDWCVVYTKVCYLYLYH